MLFRKYYTTYCFYLSTVLESWPGYCNGILTALSISVLVLLLFVHTFCFLRSQNLSLPFTFSANNFTVKLKQLEENFHNLTFWFLSDHSFSVCFTDSSSLPWPLNTGRSGAHTFYFLSFPCNLTLSGISCSLMALNAIWVPTTSKFISLAKSSPLSYIYPTTYSQSPFEQIIDISYFISYPQTCFSYGLFSVSFICSNSKSWRQILLALSLQHIQNLIISHYLHYYYPGLSYFNLLARLLQGHHNCSLCFCLCLFVLLLNIAVTVILLKQKLDHLTFFSSYLG